jgi:trimeric autotransporter adhesin
MAFGLRHDQIFNTLTVSKLVLSPSSGNTTVTLSGRDSTDGVGSDVIVEGGDATGSAGTSAGDIIVRGGQAQGSTTDAGGDATLSGGDSSGTSRAGNTTITSGGATGTANDAGDVLIGTGTSTNGVAGHVHIRTTEVFTQKFTDTDKGATTISAAELLGGLITHSAASSDTSNTDSATNINDAFRNLQTTDTFIVYAVNESAANTWTIGAGDGVTLKGGPATMAAQTGRTLLFKKTGASTFDCLIVGGS